MCWKHTHLNGVLSAVIACVFWGTTGTAASFIPDVSPLATGAFAMGVGGVLLILNARCHLRVDHRQLLAQPKVLVVGGVSVAIYPLAFYSSMSLSGVAIGTLISLASAPFFSVLLEYVVCKKSISLQWVISFFVGTLGIVLLTVGKQSHSDLGHHSTLQHWGICLGLIAGLTYAIYSWSARQMIEKGISSKSSMASMFGLAAMILLPSLLFTGDNTLSDIKHIAIMLYMAVIPMFFGYLCFGYALKQLNASKATLITLLEPAIATLFAICVVGEKFATVGWYGLVLIVMCLILQVIKLPSTRH
jgi:drug/metabolite transporter, DME family